MKRPACRRPADAFDNSSMTPMIDVVFLLLIFFVCAAARQVRESLLGADLPAGGIASAQAEEQPKPQLDRVWLTLRKGPDGVTRAELNGTEYSLGQVEQPLRQLAQIAPEIPVVLDIDGDVALGDMIHVYDACRSAHFESVHFAVDLPGKSTENPGAS
jgi:biopolymer transport protein ExbD